MRIETPTNSHAPDDGAEIKIARRHRRRPEDVLRIENSHHERCQRDQQHEWPHDSREQNRERCFIRRPTSPRQKIDKLRREEDTEQRNSAHKYGGERGGPVFKPPDGTAPLCCCFLLT